MRTQSAQSFFFRSLRALLFKSSLSAFIRVICGHKPSVGATPREAGTPRSQKSRQHRGLNRRMRAPVAAVYECKLSTWNLTAENAKNAEIGTYVVFSLRSMRSLRLLQLLFSG
jgi:hypothetical protein